ncbi:hypothetical protein swp_4678 [Shewanella piezotolerans WP3]|uniref:Uncharacterized protein n=1 Tax=Shewanella piezotolerans (strain WP3 / JCM 13877) TaxID=225849 RepID=B8CTS0_SHEPW|nr:hypothetical protein swp_4678 [Shewanella piezotolerans WP3]
MSAAFKPWLFTLALFIGQAQAYSMQGVGIFDGDILIVDRHE